MTKEIAEPRVLCKPLSELHKAALEYAARGIAIFPCVSNATGLALENPKDRKKPAFKGGFHAATTDEAQINAWWATDDFNIGTCPDHSGHYVVDVEKAGRSDWLGLWEEHDFEVDTREIDTPNGGVHLWFKGTGLSTTRKLWGKDKAIDTRGKGGYVLMPPSIVSGRRYTLTKDIEPQDLPEWIQSRIKAAADAITADPDFQVDDPGHVERARTRLKGLVERGDVAVSGNGGNTRTYQLMAEVLDLGVSPTCGVSLVEEIWNPHCVPPWSGPELAQIMKNACNHKQNPGSGAWAVERTSKIFAGIEIPEDATPPVAAKSKGPFLSSAADVLKWRDPEWLVDRFIVVGQNVCIFGPPKAGKTFIAFEVALSIAAGLPVFGQFAPRKFGAVVYLSGEGHSGIKRRLLSWCQAHGKTHAEIEALPFFYKDRVPSTAGGVAECLAYVEGIRAHIAGDPVLVVIDTMARSMRGLTENSADDVNLYIEMTEGLRDGLHCTTMTVAHAGKDASRGIRGSNAAPAGFDATFSVWTTEKGTRGLEGEDLKDMGEFGPLYFRLKPVTVEGMASDIAQGAVLEPVAAAEVKALAQTDNERKRREIFDVLTRHGIYGPERGVETARLAEMMCGPPPPEGDKKAFQDRCTARNTTDKNLRNGMRVRGNSRAPYEGFFQEYALPGATENTKLWYLETPEE